MSVQFLPVPAGVPCELDSTGLLPSVRILAVARGPQPLLRTSGVAGLP